LSEYQDAPCASRVYNHPKEVHKELRDSLHGSLEGSERCCASAEEASAPGIEICDKLMKYRDAMIVFGGKKRSSLDAEMGDVQSPRPRRQMPDGSNRDRNEFVMPICQRLVFPHISPDDVMGGAAWASYANVDARMRLLDMARHAGARNHSA
jgi:hypothetical protein